MTRSNRLTVRSFLLGILVFVGLSPLSVGVSSETNTGRLQLTIIDRETGMPVPARVDVRDAGGMNRVAEDALLVGGDCFMSEQASMYVDLASTLAGFSAQVFNPYTRSVQFYSDGSSSVSLAAGTAIVIVFKGNEYNVSVDRVEIKAGETLRHRVALDRWINMPKKGWYASDGHLHIPRPVADLNPRISSMMQAEDIHVANLLQMGSVRNFSIATQLAHGPDGHYQEGHYLLAAGQENPRTHFLGHTITLGARRTHHDPEKYLIYRRLWQATAKEGALNGFAHAYLPNAFTTATHDGMAVVLPYDLLDFVEVLQFNRSDYETWYDILNMGFRVTPTAGTDYPCAGQTIPGHERFYTKVDGPLNYSNWLEGVRKGRTFVTTGPILEFTINGQDIGSEIAIEKPMSIELRGRAAFDPERDGLSFLEVIHNGEVIRRFSRLGSAAEINFSFSHRVNQTSWFAVRGYGSQLREDTFATPIHFSSFKPTSNVHSAPIYITLENGPGLRQSARSKTVALTWLARLEDMERILSMENLEQLARKLEVPTLDAVPEATLRSNRSDLLKEILEAKKFFTTLSQPNP